MNSVAVSHMRARTREQLVFAVCLGIDAGQRIVATVLEESAEEELVLQRLGIFGHISGGLIQI